MTRTRATLRRTLARAATAVPAIVVIAYDVVHRRAAYPAMLRADTAALVVTWSLSVALWTCAIVVGARRRTILPWIARALVVVLGAVTALQAAAFEYFGTTIDFQLLRSAWRLEGMETLARPFLGVIARWMATGAIAGVAWSVLVARLARSRRSPARGASFALIPLLAVSLVTTTYLPHVSTDAAPDVLALGAVGRFTLERPTRGSTASSPVVTPDVDFPRTVPPLAPAEPRVRRNVLLVLTESVRASAVCSAYGPDCPHNPFSNALLPNRLPLERMRAVDSFTLLSFGVIFTGLPVTAPRAQWLSAPLLFDYAHAAHMATAYWSAHHAGFANSHDWTDHEPIDRLAWATDFDPRADKVLGADDADVAARATAELGQLHEPFLAVVHFSGTHYPYRVSSDAPFRPLGTALDRDAPEPLRNRYFDAIYRQDQITARLVDAVRAMPLGARTVVVFVSDHGESFYEHGSVLHGSSLWDEELRVPAWIDAPSGLLSPDETASLRDLRDVPVTEQDLAPTVLDLLGIRDVAAWRELTAHMAGESLLRSPAHDRVAPIATCNEVWPCFVASSGKLIGDFKWVARPPEPYRCFDTRTDPLELHELGADACGER